MDCRILRQIMIKGDGHIVCDDSNGYFIPIGELSNAPGWNIMHILRGATYRHIRRSFAAGRVPWEGVCETCDLFSLHGEPKDTLNKRLKIMIEPTLACHLNCQTCKRKVEASRRAGAWELDPALFEALLRSCAANNLLIEEIQYLGWGEPLLHSQFAELTRIARRLAPHAVQEVTTTGNADFHEGLRGCELDRVVFSCDGVQQESYEKFRRNGNLERVWQFMADTKGWFPGAKVEWKYILFEDNDQEADIIVAQEKAVAFNLDSILFILTNSKNRSKKFTVDNMDEFPLVAPIAKLSPAAANLKTQWTGKVKPESSSPNKNAASMLYIDRCVITSSRMLVIDGWCLDSSLKYVSSIDLVIGNNTAATFKPESVRHDVVGAHPGAEGGLCGFHIGVPTGRSSAELHDDIRHLSQLRFLVTTSDGSDDYRFEMEYHSAG